jgi:formylglycine-generating enzyme required for sulfatase activity
VSWRDAIGYCAWLGSTLRYQMRTPPELRRLLASGWRIVLPSEPEWEKAARGTGGRRYPWGDTYSSEYAVFGGTEMSLVGTFPKGASPYGVMDMSGNAWEWTRSLYRPYPYVPTDGRESLQADGAHVIRGGSFQSTVRYGRTAARNFAAPPGYGDAIGFRVALARP